MREGFRHGYINSRKKVTRIAEIKLADTMKRGCNYFSVIKRITAATGMPYCRRVSKPVKIQSMFN